MTPKVCTKLQDLSQSVVVHKYIRHVRMDACSIVHVRALVSPIL
jgi:hypothetical protein